MIPVSSGDGDEKSSKLELFASSHLNTGFRRWFKKVVLPRIGRRWSSVEGGTAVPPSIRVRSIWWYRSYVTSVQLPCPEEIQTQNGRGNVKTQFVLYRRVPPNKESGLGLDAQWTRCRHIWSKTSRLSPILWRLRAERITRTARAEEAWNWHHPLARASGESSMPPEQGSEFVAAWWKAGSVPASPQPQWMNCPSASTPWWRCMRKNDRIKNTAALAAAKPRGVKLGVAGAQNIKKANEKKKLLIVYWKGNPWFHRWRVGKHSKRSQTSQRNGNQTLREVLLPSSVRNYTWVPWGTRSSAGLGFQWKTTKQWTEPSAIRITNHRANRQRKRIGWSTRRFLIQLLNPKFLRNFFKSGIEKSILFHEWTPL